MPPVSVSDDNREKQHCVRRQTRTRIVDNSAPLVRKEGVAPCRVREALDVSHDHLLDELDGILAGESHTKHVRHVEERGALPALQLRAISAGLGGTTR